MAQRAGRGITASFEDGARSTVALEGVCVESDITFNFFDEVMPKQNIIIIMELLVHLLLSGYRSSSNSGRKPPLWK